MAMKARGAGGWRKKFQRAISEYCKAICLAVGFREMSRSGFRDGGSDELLFLENNLAAGPTPTSILFRLWTSSQRAQKRFLPFVIFFGSRDGTSPITERSLYDRHDIGSLDLPTEEPRPQPPYKLLWKAPSRPR